MTLYNSKKLLDTLENGVKETIKSATYLQSLNTATLGLCPAKGKWSVLQVVYHLNSYNEYYLPNIERAMLKGKKIAPEASFKPGLLGNYFANMMLLGKDGKVTKAIKAPKDHAPAEGYKDIAALAEFIQGQRHLLELINEARGVNMTQTTVPISISKFIKIRLGDTFRFLIAHQQRHFVQITNTLKAVGVEWAKAA